MKIGAKGKQEFRRQQKLVEAEGWESQDTSRKEQVIQVG